MRNSVYIPDTVCEQKHTPGASKLQTSWEPQSKKIIEWEQNGCLCSVQKYT